jgi:NAD dependent epimerase/dehydratase family enzyme
LLGKLTRWFLGGQVGNGRQYISWIHIADLSRLVLASIESEEVGGVFNATSPNPVTNAEFMRELRRALHRPWSPPVPEFAARLGSWLMGTEASLALVSQRCVPKRFLENGFTFEFSELHQALANIFPSR